ncbi:MULTISPECIES: hypothetical protein [Lactococcus]|uniref:Secreted protein n=1 Tax=Lactococcus lactis subsp. cremoris TaxID=1359 RepID=A0A166J495_LACLC|nr:hypothetical protein [Lactococcus cremoris]KZK05507.1 hypothetical protein AB996_1795 [Lactococcus cremoris]
MKKITLLTASILALGTAGFTAGSQVAHADVATPSAQSVGISARSNAGITIADTGKFESPINLSAYDHELNGLGMGFQTGEVTINYDSKALVSFGLGMTKHFNLKLPKEFDAISTMNGGLNLRNAITASYKLPGATDYTDFEPEDINTAYAGQIDFRLSPTCLVNLGSTTKIRITIDYGKILDGLKVPAGFDYKSIIQDSKAGGYIFRGVLTDNECIQLWPDTAAEGITNGIEATLYNGNGTVPSNP